MAESRLEFERAGARTVVRSALAVAPLRLLTPRNHGSGAWVYTTTLGGGLVGGDGIELRAALGAGARAVLSSQGATRIYRGGVASSAVLEIDLAEGALLANLPDPTACFAGSRFEQRTSIRMAAGASLALVEWVTAGRGGRDGRWALARYRSALQLEGVLDEALLLDAEHGPLARRLGRLDCLATVILRGPLLAASAAAALGGAERAGAGAEVAERAGAAALEARELPPAKGAALVEAASPIDGGAVVRIAAVSAEAVARRVREIFAALPGLLGDDPFARRA